MNKKMKELKKMADEAGVTTDELITEMETGSNVKKPFTVAVSFDRMSEMIAFAKMLTDTGVGVYRADSLDPEYGGRAGGNRFVLRTVHGFHGKPEKWRVDSEQFKPNDPDFAED